MEAILEFFVNNYLWFLIISLILIFGLIGYIVDTHENRSPKLHFGEDIEEDETIEETDKSLKEMLEEDNNESANNEEFNINNVEVVNESDDTEEIKELQ